MLHLSAVGKAGVWEEKGVIERLELTDFISLSVFVILLPWS